MKKRYSTIHDIHNDKVESVEKNVREEYLGPYVFYDYQKMIMWSKGVSTQSTRNTELVEERGGSQQ